MSVEKVIMFPFVANVCEPCTGCGVENGDIPWATTVDDKLMLQAGFTSTLVKSLSVTGNDVPSGISWDGTDTLWSGIEENKLWRNSGQFTSTIKDSQDVSSFSSPSSTFGISWDGTNSLWCHLGSPPGVHGFLMLLSGSFTSTVLASEDVGSIDNLVMGISYDAGDTPWVGGISDKLYEQSGQFTSTLKKSLDISAIELGVTDISFNGTDTYWCGNTDRKLYLQSGQYTTTMKDSLGGIDGPSGINTNTATVG